MGRIIAAIAAGIVLLASPGAASAQTAEQQALGLQISQMMFKMLSLEDIIEKEAQDDADFLSELKSRPEWKGYLIAAMQEEIRHDMPAIEQMFGRALAASMTVDELRVGVTFLKDPAMQDAIKSNAEGRQSAARPSREVERMMRTPAGVSFLGKLENIEKTLGPMFEAFMIEILPGTLRRFADKAEAGEARRAAGQPAVK